MDATETQEAFAVNKGYAEPVIKKIEKKVADVKRKTKVEPEAKKRSKKQDFVGHKSFE